MSADFTLEAPCPICRGHRDGFRDRCTGHVDERALHCSSAMYAGGLGTDTASGTYAHARYGRCRCGVMHNAGVELGAEAGVEKTNGAAVHAAAAPSIRSPERLERQRAAPVDRTAGEAEDATLERRVLGGMLLAGRFEPGLEFVIPRHAWIYAAMGRVGLSLAALIGELETAGRLENCGGIPAVLALVDEPTAAHLAVHVAQLQARARVRRIRALSEGLADSPSEWASRVAGLREAVEARPAESALRQAFLRSAATSLQELRTTKPTPRDWLVDRLLINGKVGTLVAPGGAGKGHFAMQLALALGSGTPLGPFAVPRARGVLWLSLEDDLAEQKRRLQDGIAARWLGKSDTEREALIDRHVMLQDLCDEPDAHIDNPEFAKLIIEFGRMVPSLALVIIDPLSLIIPERADFDLNSVKGAKEIHRFARAIAKALGCAVLLVHHTTKNASRSGTELDAGAGTGSKQIVDLARWNINGRTLKSDEAAAAGLDFGRWYFEIEPPKNNYAPPLKERCIWRRTDGGALIYVPIRTILPSDPERAIAVLAGLPADAPATNDAWEKACAALQPALTRRSFEKARDSLAAQKRVEKLRDPLHKKRGQPKFVYRICG